MLQNFNLSYILSPEKCSNAKNRKYKGQVLKEYIT